MLNIFNSAKANIATGKKAASLAGKGLRNHHPPENQKTADTINFHSGRS